MLNIQRALNIGGINPNIGFASNGRVSFKQAPDRVELQSLDRFFSEALIRRMLENNSKVKNIVKKFNPNLNLNMEELRELQQGHAKDTQNIVESIVDNLPHSMRFEIDKKSLNEAAYLHDLGKVLIPKEVLNKPAKLNSDELAIMSTHSELGYEMLKKMNLSERTLNLIKDHHKKSTGNFLNRKPDLTLQVLSTADKYSALTENRVYKQAMTPKEALAIIYRDVENGDLDQRVFLALAKQAKSAVENSEKLSV